MSSYHGRTTNPAKYLSLVPSAATFLGAPWATNAGRRKRLLTNIRICCYVKHSCAALGGRRYTSLEVDNVIRFSTSETLAKVSQANPGLLAKDIRQAQHARDVLCEIPIRNLIRMMQKAADLYKDATLPMGDGVQSPADFARQHSASTGPPEHMCKANMAKNHFVLSNMDRILDCLTRA